MLKNLYQKTKRRLEQAGIDTPELDARLILQEALGITDADLISNANISVGTAASSPSPEIELCKIKKINEWLERRIEGEPVSRILGTREFWGLNFKITPDVLDPRPDTETIIEIALKRFKGNPPQNILDLGTGSGCILIALLHEWPDAKGIGVDISEAALEVAGENARANNVHERAGFMKGNWSESIRDSFDLIVSNPPYIQNQTIANLAKEVKNHDPILALDGGADGLQAYKYIFTEIRPLLKKDGMGLFEIGYDQQKDVVRLVEESNLIVAGVHADLAGQPRVVEISSGDK